MSNADRIEKWTRESANEAIRNFMLQAEKIRREADKIVLALTTSEKPLEQIEPAILLGHLDSSARWLSSYAGEAEKAVAELRIKSEVLDALRRSKEDAR